jgi:hypothetical protein
MEGSEYLSTIRMDTRGGIVRLILEEQEWDILMARRDTPGYGDHPDQSCHRAFTVLLHLDLIYCCISMDIQIVVVHIGRFLCVA